MAVLSKLLKYDLRANLKIFLFIWPAILVFGLLERVALMAELPSEIGFAEADAFLDAGAACVTHLFNAMSPLGHREPGGSG